MFKRKASIFFHFALQATENRDGSTDLLPAESDVTPLIPANINTYIKMSPSGKETILSGDEQLLSPQILFMSFPKGEGKG